MANTVNLNLPLIDDNMVADVPRGMNALAEAVDSAVVAAVEAVEIPNASLTVAGKTMLSNETNGVRETLAPTEKALGLVMKEATAGKQAGIDRKAETVAALNSIGITATISETWSQLIPKIAAVIRATGAATAAQVLAGAGFSSATGNNRIGTMPVRGANVNATGTGRWPDGALAVYFPDGWYGGGLNGGSEAKVTPAQIRNSFPEIASGNVRAGVEMLGVVGKGTVVDTEGSSADVASLLYAGRVAYANGQRVVGALPDRSGNITPQTYNVAIPAGYHNGQGVVLGYVPGAQHATGTNTADGVGKWAITGLSFQPNTIIIWNSDNDIKIALSRKGGVNWGAMRTGNLVSNYNNIVMGTTINFSDNGLFNNKTFTWHAYA